MSIPNFAVVGHPNKGKSSLVATLAQDDSVKISMTPGTTMDARHFPMKVDGQILYKLIDTPGFQRARQVLKWLKAHETGVDKRPQIVAEFVNTFQGSNKFHDECQLLEPIINGAGILYVVDGSRPYGSEYEAEMEVLRWTGQPSMGLINMIGDGNYQDQWHTALSQFFRIVRVFNALEAEFEKHIELLQAFGQLKESWRTPLTDAVTFLQNKHKSQRSQSMRIIAEMLSEEITFTQSKKLSAEENLEDYKADLKKDFFKQLQKKEIHSRQQIEKTYSYHNINRNESSIEIHEQDLFAKKTWSVFGLSQQELLMTGVAGGAAMGTVVDIAVGGASLLLGAGVGALIGGVSAILSYDKLAGFKVLGLPLGGNELQIGPMKNRNFPYVLLGRAMAHFVQIKNRTHAMRNILEIEDADGNTGASKIPADLRRGLEKTFSDIRSKGSTPETLTQLSELIHRCLNSVEN